MKITTSYTISFKDGYNAVKRTTVIFNCAIQYLTEVSRVNCFRNWKDDTDEIKVHRNNDWVCQKIRFNHSDRVYLERKAGNMHLSAPVLVKKHGKYELRFTLEKEVKLSSREIFNQKVCAVDLGITTDATCSVLDVHGTVLSRKFIACGREKDSVANALHRASVFQRLHGAHDTGRLWNVANLNRAHLSASYNIGARYIIRELIKVVPDIMTKVCDIGSGTARKLSTLWNIKSAMVI